MGILDTIIDAKRGSLAHEFAPLSLVEKILGLLKERDRKILTKRHGLLNHDRATLEAIGAELKLTRERVRQIEKHLLIELKKQVKELEDFQKHSDLLHGAISSRGGLVSEIDLLEAFGIKAVAEANALRFLLILIEGIEELKDSKLARDGWKTLGFDENVFSDFLSAMHEVLKSDGKPKEQAKLLELIKQTPIFEKYVDGFSNQVMQNFLSASKALGKNPLGEYGLSHWPEVRPRDVGDKAYLALKHHGKPAHYREITKIINSLQFSSRRAHDETVHNELIKDSRFVLIGRGIYALEEWGYKPGVVEDVIAEVLRERSGGPVQRDLLVEEVMRRRVVKRNTVLVSLSNRRRFTKEGKDAYSLVEKT